MLGTKGLECLPNENLSNNWGAMQTCYFLKSIKEAI